MKVYSAVVLDALIDSLRTVYWFQEDLRSFLTRAGVPIPTLGTLPWGSGTYKRVIARQLVDHLAAEPSYGMPVLNCIIDSLVELDEEFPHLARLEDGKKKAGEARDALRRLKDLLGKQDLLQRAERARREARTEAERAREVIAQRRKDLNALSDRFLALCAIAEDGASKRRRGLQFQDLLRDLFALHDLEPRGSFSRPGDQVDGSITLEGKFILVEAKWEAQPIEPKEIRDFQGKVTTNRLAATLGIFVSMSGYTENAIAAAAAGEIVVILIDGVDLAHVFQGLIDLREMLRRKLRQAADKGQPLYRVGTES